MSSIAGGLLLAVVAGMLNGSWNVGFSSTQTNDEHFNKGGTSQDEQLNDTESSSSSSPLTSASPSQSKDNQHHRQQHRNLGYHHAFALFQFYAALINIPICLCWAGGPERVNYIIQEASAQDISLVCLFSIVWGLGSLGFGLACKIAGIGLGTNLCLGVVMVLGTFLPLCMEGTIATTAGAVVILGLAFCCTGLVFSAWSLQARDAGEQDVLKVIKNVDSSTHIGSDFTMGITNDVEQPAVRTSIAAQQSADPSETEEEIVFCDADETSFQSLTEDMIHEVANISIAPEAQSSTESMIHDVDEHSFRTCFTLGHTLSNASSKKLGEMIVDVDEPSDRSFGHNSSRTLEEIVFCDVDDLEQHITETKPTAEGKVVAKREEDKASLLESQLEQKQEYSTFYKVLVCIIAGVFGTQLQFVFVFGKDLIDLAEDNEQGPGSTPTGGGPAVIWLLAIPLGAPVWIFYGLYNSPLPISAIWKCPWYKHVLLMLVTSIPWIAHIHLYGYSTSLLPEDLAAAVSWPTIMSVTVVTSILWSLGLGEWEFASKRAMRKLFQGVGFVLFGIAIIMASVFF